MNDHDLTPELEALLADAATGDLGPEDAERLRAAITERPRLADLLAEQRNVAGRLDPGPEAGLSDLERAHLRRSVLDEVVGAEMTPAARPAARPMPWARWAFAAAAVAVVVVASVGLLSTRLGGDDFANISDEVAVAPESDDRTTAGTAEEDDVISEAAVPEADVGGVDEAAGDDGGAGDSALAIPSCPTPGRSVDDLVGRVFDSPDAARVAAESSGTDAFSGEPEPVEAADRLTWVWRDDTGSVTGLLEVVDAPGGWRVERAEACD